LPGLEILPASSSSSSVNFVLKERSEVQHADERIGFLDYISVIADKFIIGDNFIIGDRHVRGWLESPPELCTKDGVNRTFLPA